ncbi:hypothetical protein EXIGLDRAFT_727663 [Exidia glandulosa HHB12029]|uniref:Uncharacterized protein n=1 Tax=Exidia glandulosa HHB12029 TaxID=1314781 RepID=A0A165M0H0_EXIGL|nr:hypothetical protein EXIGLDRAFT_727663 [Exidia glandulosa HHB12029]
MASRLLRFYSFACLSTLVLLCALVMIRLDSWNAPLAPIITFHGRRECGIMHHIRVQSSARRGGKRYPSATVSFLFWLGAREI